MLTSLFFKKQNAKLERTRERNIILGRDLILLRNLYNQL